MARKTTSFGYRIKTNKGFIYTYADFAKTTKSFEDAKMWKCHASALKQLKKAKEVHGFAYLVTEDTNEFFNNEHSVWNG